MLGNLIHKFLEYVFLSLIPLLRLPFILSACELKKDDTYRIVMCNEISASGRDILSPGV